MFIILYFTNLHSEMEIPKIQINDAQLLEQQDMSASELTKEQLVEMIEIANK